jgi:DNA (cytosine-5)-methyltransferase 1
VVFGNDIKAAALRTFQLNHADDHGTPETILGDVRLVSVEEIRAALDRSGVEAGNLDCMIGGPPCQGMSQLRRSEERCDNKIVRFKGYNRLDQDPRNDLVLRFLEVANVLRPKMLVIENVPQLLKHGHNGKLGGLADSIRTLLCEMGYDAQVRKVNAADYGVPQLRERAIICASRVGAISLPPTTHANPLEETLDVEGLLPWVTVEDAIKDLPSPPVGTQDLLGGGPSSLYNDVVGPSAFALKMRTSLEFPFNHVARTYDKRILQIIDNMQPGEEWDAASARMQREYASLIQQSAAVGEDFDAARQRLIASGTINPTFYKRYYWSAYTRLAWNLPALTITANANFLGSGRFTHPTARRGITMREAARLQSFDDNFKFATSLADEIETTNIGVGLDMIGEAVPPLLAQAIAEHLAHLLDSAGHRADATQPTFEEVVA